MKLRHWEDRFIFGSRGYYYVRVGNLEAGYFSRKERARAYVRAYASWNS